MLFSLLRAAAAGAIVVLLCNCSGPGRYPLSGQVVSADDPVQDLQAGNFIVTEASF